jgi:hypothetical protein
MGLETNDKITIYNALGSRIELPKTINQESIYFDTKSLASGFYFIQIETPNTVEKVKLQVIK